MPTLVHFSLTSNHCPLTPDTYFIRASIQPPPRTRSPS